MYKHVYILDFFTIVQFGRYSSEWKVYCLDKNGEFSIQIIYSSPNLVDAHACMLLDIFFST